MRWLVVAVVVGLAAVAGASTLLLAFGGDRHDPVGQLSPVAHIEPAPTAPTHGRPAAPPRGEHERDD